jgi:hypothetical protein
MTAAFLCLTALVSPCDAQSDTFTVKGTGNQLCRNWTATHDGRSDDDKMKAAFQLSWVLGYLTATRDGLLRAAASLEGRERRWAGQSFKSYCESQTSADSAYDGHAISIGNHALRIRKGSPAIAFRLDVNLHCLRAPSEVQHFGPYHRNELCRRLGGFAHGVRSLSE